MNKIVAALSLLFVILTFAGAGYVLYTGGEASPGYAAVPMIFALGGIGFLRKNR